MARKKDLAGLAALGALGYALSRGKGGEDIPVEDRTGVAPSADYSNEGRTPVRAPTRMPSAGGVRAPVDMREPVHVDAEAGMTRGTRPRDPRDAEAGMSRGTRSTSLAGAGRGMVNPPIPQANSTTAEGMRGYAPRRTPGPLTDVNRPGTRVRYENEDTYKKGGKTKKMAAGGRTASQRADGIASKGKTKCKMY